MKKNLLLAAVLGLYTSFAWGSARGLSSVQLTGDDDGNTRVGVAVSCTSSAWTLVVSARTHRRGVKLKASDSNGGILCLGTDDSGGTCSTAQLGYELGTGDGYEDAGEGPLYCRAATGTQVVKGFDLYDTGDGS